MQCVPGDVSTNSPWQVTDNPGEKNKYREEQINHTGSADYNYTKVTAFEDTHYILHYNNQ